MTDNNENNASLKEFLFDLDDNQEVPEKQLTPEQQKELEQRMSAVAEKFLLLMKDLKKEADQINNRDMSLELETRQMNITLPASAWAVTENVRDMLEIQCDMGDALPIPPEYKHILEFYREKANNSSMDEILISQAIFEALFNLSSIMAQAEIGRRLNQAMATEDPNAIKRTLQFIVSALTGKLPEDE